MREQRDTDAEYRRVRERRGRPRGPRRPKAGARPDPRLGSPRSDRRERLIRRLEALGFETGVVERAVRDGTADQLTVLSDLAATAGRATSKRSAYAETLDWIGEEYIGILTRGSLAAADVTPEQLHEAADILAETAGMMRAIPARQRDAMWVPIGDALAAASSHYGNVSRAMTGTGISAALEAQDHVVITGLEASAIPAIDLELLRAAGYRDPERALSHLVDAARSAPRTLGAGETLENILGEGQRMLEPTQPLDLPAPTRPKRWAGFAKLLTGAAIAGINIAGGVALGIGGGPLAAGVTLGGVLSSSATGVGMIIEGVGSLRGE